MRIIAHRGLTEGPDATKQNNPAQIDAALALGFDAEIDVWLCDDHWFLGHDEPDVEVNFDYLTKPRLWIHCKNMDAFKQLRRLGSELNFFWHENDQVTLTSQLFIWTYFGRPHTMHEFAICVMPEVTYPWDDVCDMARDGKWYGICTDYPRRLRACLG